MHFQPLDNAPLAETVPRRALPPAQVLAFAGGLFAVATSFALLGGVDQHPTIWPVTGVVAALSLPGAAGRFRERLSLNLLGGAGVFAGAVLSGLPWVLAVVIAGVTILSLMIVGLCMSPHVQTFDDLKVRRNGMRLVLASILASLLTGLLGAVRLTAFLKIPPLRMGAMAALADALGIVICVPLVLFLTAGKHLGRLKLPRNPLTWLCLACFTLVCCGVFWQNTGPYLFLIFPPMMMLAMVAGLEGALYASMMVTLIGCYATAHGHGPVYLARNSTPEMRLITLQLFLWVSVVTVLPVGAALDERRKAEAAAKKALLVKRTILEHVRDAIVLSSLDGSERYASSAIEALTGWTPAEYMKLDRLQSVHPEDRLRALRMIESFVDGIQETSLRYRLLQKNGDWRWVEASVSAYGDGVTEGYVGTIRDIERQIETEQGWIEERRAFTEEQQRLAEAENAAKYQLQMRDEFLSNVSHELRSPLTSIYSFSSIIADGLAGATTPEQDEYLTIVLKNVVQLQSMIEDLLTVTQSREGKLNIQPRKTSMTDAVVDAFNTVQAFAKRKRITLTAKPSDHLASVYADPIRVRQVLIILLDNAIKFTPEDGSVQVAVSMKSPDFLLAKVIDTGCGISAEQCDLVFNKLYQVTGSAQRDTSTAGRTGLGLGLHIARSLIVRQSGHIWVTSVLDEGSTFQFTLPVYRDQETASPAEDQSAGEETAEAAPAEAEPVEVMNHAAG